MNREQESLQQIVYGISHDMGAPLRSVVRFSELLQTRLDGRLDETERYWLQLVQHSGEKGQAMIDALLRYSRLATQMDTPKSIVLNQLVSTVVEEQLRKHLPRHYDADTSSLCKVTSPLPDIVGSYNHWYLFFSCIIDNAFLYQPLSDSAHIPYIHIYSEKINNITRIIIEDNGIGASSEQRLNLTRPFMRGWSEQDYPGIGMGLAYCDRVAQLHGGLLSFNQSSIGGLAVNYEFNHDG